MAWRGARAGQARTSSASREQLWPPRAAPASDPEREGGGGWGPEATLRRWMSPGGSLLWSHNVTITVTRGSPHPAMLPRPHVDCRVRGCEVVAWGSTGGCARGGGLGAARGGGHQGDAGLGPAPPAPPQLTPQALRARPHTSGHRLSHLPEAAPRHGGSRCSRARGRPRAPPQAAPGLCSPR